MALEALAVAIHSKANEQPLALNLYCQFEILRFAAINARIILYTL